MKICRRDFLKLSAAAGLTAAFGGLGLSLAPTAALAADFKLKNAKQTTSVCCYCGVGCGLIVHTDPATNRAVNVEGDPDHPINEGSLCAKGASVWQLAENQLRPPKPLYRAPYSDKWEEKSWEWVLDAIARRVKDTRDATFAEKNAKGQVVNRCEGLASVGSAAMDNEECWIYQTFLRALGLVYIEHQARICHSASVPALAESFGRGAMTNHFIDIKNADAILIMGANTAETHPITFKWVMRAKDAGVALIHVDPRFTRTSAKADIHAYMRSGCDIPIFGGMINYILQNNLFFKEFVVNYTNASLIVGKDFSFKDGLFSGFDAANAKYDRSSWVFEKDDKGVPVRDLTLKHERCVFNLLKKHYSRYTLDNVSKTAGTPKADLEKVYKAYAATGKPDKSGTMLYAMGQTQHSVGVQNIRTMAMIQLLLGNVGNAGGGINALRGESNVQGSTDMALLYHIIPGYLATPAASLPTLEAYNEKNTPKSADPMSVNWWSNLPKYSASLLKAMFPGPDPATSYNYLPKLDDGQNASWLKLFDEMSKGAFKGFFAWGMNPACSSANAPKTRKAMENLDWMVNVNLFDNETGSFWRGPGVDPKKVKTEVFFLPCAVFMEKEGSLTNSGRWMQWRYEGPKPRGESKPDGDLIAELALKVKKLYAAEGGKFAEPVLSMDPEGWMTNHAYDPRKVIKILNGSFLKDVKIGETVYKAGTLVPSFAMLQADGATSSGCWIYCGCCTEKGNMAMRRDKAQTPMQATVGLFPNWSWSWPVNRRIIYNRASVDLTGKPYAPQKAVLAWDAAEKKWVGDVVDGGGGPGEKHPFIMTSEGFGRLFGPGRMDGPFPEHYEPYECPISAHPFSKQLHNPTALHFKGEYKAVCDPKFPFVCTSYRLTEHWQTGHMTRHTPWLLEAEPQMFCEMSPELAKLRGIKNGEKVILESVRGNTWAIAMVTPRLKPFTVMGNTVHLLGVPYHYGWQFPENGEGGDSANLLTPAVGDPNTGIPETKAFMVNMRKA